MSCSMHLVMQTAEENDSRLLEIFNVIVRTVDWLAFKRNIWIDHVQAHNTYICWNIILYRLIIIIMNLTWNIRLMHGNNSVKLSIIYLFGVRRFSGINTINLLLPSRKKLSNNMLYRDSRSVMIFACYSPGFSQKRKWSCINYCSFFSGFYWHVIRGIALLSFLIKIKSSSCDGELFSSQNLFSPASFLINCKISLGNRKQKNRFLKLKWQKKKKGHRTNVPLIYLPLSFSPFNYPLPKLIVFLLSLGEWSLFF